MMTGLIGVLGDIHAEDILLAHALEHMTRARVSCILAVGDIADGPGDLDRTCELLREHHVIAVRGNHERWFLADTLRDLPDATPIQSVRPATLHYLHSLPASHEMQTPRGSLFLCHGLGDNDMAGVRPDDDGYALDSNDDLWRLVRAGHRYVVNGHTHQPMVRTFGATTIINAGTLLRHHEPGFVILDLDASEARFLSLSASGRTDLVERIPVDEPAAPA